MNFLRPFILLLFVGVCLAQAPTSVLNTFIISKETVLSGSAEVVTVQQPASSARTVQGVAASIYCSVACVIELERDGTAATGTTLTVVDVAGQSTSAAATAWHTSDVGNGTTLSKHTIGAGNTLVLDLNALYLVGAGTAKNFTLRTDSITGTVQINVMWREW